MPEAEKASHCSVRSRLHWTSKPDRLIAQAGINKQDMETEPKAKKRTNSSSGCLPHGTRQRKHSACSKIWLENLNIYV